VPLGGPDEPLAGLPPGRVALGAALGGVARLAGGLQVAHAVIVAAHDVVCLGCEPNTAGATDATPVTVAVEDGGGGGGPVRG
jgi:hypothetical protein